MPSHPSRHQLSPTNPAGARNPLFPVRKKSLEEGQRGDRRNPRSLDSLRRHGPWYTMPMAVQIGVSLPAPLGADRWEGDRPSIPYPATSRPQPPSSESIAFPPPHVLAEGPGIPCLFRRRPSLPSHVASHRTSFLIFIERAFTVGSLSDPTNRLSPS